MKTDHLHSRYLRRLEGWPTAMRRYLYVLPERPDLGCFGPGDHGHWAMQANNTAATAFAVLATDTELDTDRAGMSRDELLAWSLRLIRFSINSHCAGSGTTTDDIPWGHSWISSLSLERMMHGVEAIDAFLTDQDRELFERVLTSECNWLLDAYHRGATEKPGAITAGLVKQNHPENNIWNGCMLHRTARLFPDTARYDEYIEKGTGFLLNGISIEADALSSEIFAGKPLSEWHVGANFFPSYALNHHGYMNVGYMVICLSNIAMLHFSCRDKGWNPPEGLYLHARNLWQLVKTCTFPDGRLWRIGGDTRVRYSYCQDYAVPTWLLALDHFGDKDVESLESGWLSILETEASTNNDGSFLSARTAPLESMSPTYYTRLEGDRAVSLSMGAYWRRRLLEGYPQSGQAQIETPDSIALLSDWSDAFHGSMLVRGKKRLASWTWCAAEPPQGQCLPPAASSMAEWRGNLSGRVRGLGLAEKTECSPTQQDSFCGGFATCGRLVIQSRWQLVEGATDYDAAFIKLACVALPDDRTMLVLQQARVGHRTWLKTVKGLFLQIPNDLFNGFRRTVISDEGKRVLQGCSGHAQNHNFTSDWLSVDNCLSVIRLFGPPLSINQPAQRQIAINGKEQGGGQLYADEICCGCTEGTHVVEPHTTLFDLGAVLLTGVDATETQRVLASHPPAPIPCSGADVRAVKLWGADDKCYYIIVNYGDTEATETLSPLRGNPQVLAGCQLIHNDANEIRIVVQPGYAGVITESGLPVTR